MTPTDVIPFPNQVYTEKNGRNIDGVADFFESNILPEVEEWDSNLRLVIHAPYSDPHLVRKNGFTSFKEVYNEDGTSLETTDGDVVVIPETGEIFGDELTRLLGVLTSQIQSESLRAAIEALGVKYSLMEVRRLWGEYLPVQLDLEDLDNQFKSVDPIKFITAFLLRLHLENQDFDRSLSVVFHTDYLFFAEGGDIEGENESLDYLDELASLLGMSIYIENNETSNRPVFDKALRWSQDPLDLAAIVKGKSGRESLGICLDIKHELINGRTPDEIIREIETLTPKVEEGEPRPSLLIHARTTYPDPNVDQDDKQLISQEDHTRVMTAVMSKGLPFAYEPSSKEEAKKLP